MWHKKYRWRGQIGGDFFAQAKKSHSPLLTVYYQPNAHLTWSQLAIIVPKKVCPLSVTRHQVKRRLRVVAGEVIAQLPVGNYVLVVHQDLKKTTDDDIIAAIMRL